MEEVNDDIFKYLSQTNELIATAHCISKNLKMAQGIAVRYQETFDLKKNLLAFPNIIIGKAYPIECGNLIIFNLITKDMHYDKPTLLSLKNTLIDMKKYIDEHRINKLLIPKLGCGLDRLNWNDVKKIILDIFNDNISNGMKIYVYYL